MFRGGFHNWKTPDIAIRQYHTTLCEQHTCGLWRCARTTALTAPSPPSPRLTRQLYLCPTCEGLLLAAAAGLPLPMVCDGDGELEAAIGGFLLRLLVTRAAGCALD